MFPTNVILQRYRFTQWRSQPCLRQCSFPKWTDPFQIFSIAFTNKALLQIDIYIFPTNENIRRGAKTNRSLIFIADQKRWYVFSASEKSFFETGMINKKKRENVGIFPKSGPPPLPPVWEFFPDFTVYFWGSPMLKTVKKWMWDSGRPPPLFFQNSHIFPFFFFWQRPLVISSYLAV